MKKFLIPLLCLSSGTVLASESNCDYKTVVNTDFQGTITSSKNYNKTTYPHVEDTRKCIIKLDVKINEAWYPTSGTYIFGPDMTENAACKRAEVRAKESILREVVPENLNRTMNQNCAVHVRTVPVKKAPVLKYKSKRLLIVLMECGERVAGKTYILLSQKDAYIQIPSQRLCGSMVKNSSLTKRYVE